MIIYIRSEVDINEFRTPIVPMDIGILLSAGYKVFIESSTKRVYSDSKYRRSGAIVTHKPWYDEEFKDALILGIKKIPNLEKLQRHTHIYFSHTYKNQIDSPLILAQFEKTDSRIYDIEYFMNSIGKRIISFGNYAGITGCALGLLQPTTQIKPWDSYEAMLSELKNKQYNYLKIGIIGSNGRCGQGVQTILQTLNIPYTIINKSQIETLEPNELSHYDIVFNCILLDPSYSRIWFNSQSICTKPILIVDISCDYTKINNPIQIYTQATTWEKPIFQYNENISVIAIENLPSLLPKESSDTFSSQLSALLIDYTADTYGIWKRALSIFYDKVKSL